MENVTTLDKALRDFDKVEANVTKLKKVWHKLQQRAPDSVAFGLDTPDVDDLRRAFDDLASALPAIDGFEITARPWVFDDISQARLDAQDVGFIEAMTDVERQIDEPGREIAEYQYRLRSARRSLVRQHVYETVSQIESILSDVTLYDGMGQWCNEPRWTELSDAVSRLDRLAGNMVPRQARWSELHRHLSFAESTDLKDIKQLDWPSVREEIETGLYSDHEPIPIDANDLGIIARSQPEGSVSTRLCWESLSDRDFEAAIYELIQSTQGYQNTNWLMRTHAPDRGRDIETYRVYHDPLGGTRTNRVIVQCRNTPNGTVGRKEIVQCIDAVKMWPPPPVDVLVFATSGRFSQDAVEMVEQRYNNQDAPIVERWPDSHLETLLARRPDLAARYGLR